MKTTESETITARSYTLHNDNGSWLGQIVLTSDGLFASVTDYGNFSYAWRHYGEGDFRKFLITVNVDYFGGKMYQGMTYMIHGKTYEKACHMFAEKILPALQKVLKKEIESDL